MGTSAAILLRILSLVISWNRSINSFSSWGTSISLIALSNSYHLQIFKVNPLKSKLLPAGN
ncbi:unknown [Tannerella sp. CAG:118]|nr:unknown [Tannerella sp. CAG:118]